MLEIRHVTDTQAIRELHAAMDLDYKLYPESPDFRIANGMYDDGKLIAVVLGRLTTEAYLLLDKKWASPAARWDAVQRLAQVSADEAKSVYGIQDTHIWLPPKAGCFMRRLQRMGFELTPWPCMTVRL